MSIVIQLINKYVVCNPGKSTNWCSGENKQIHKLHRNHVCFVLSEIAAYYRDDSFP